MPTYDRGCPKCKYVFEIKRSIIEDSPVPCPKCNGPSIQLFLRNPTMFTRNIDHPDSPLDDMPGADNMRKQADFAINKALKDMGMN